MAKPKESDSYRDNFKKIEPARHKRNGIRGELGGLGTGLKGYLALNEWPQLIFQDWAKEVGDNAGPHASQIGKLLRDEVEPNWTFFVRLGDFNHDVANNSLNHIRNVKLRKRLTEGKPFVMDSGRVATDLDFFGMFTGSTAVPNEYVVAAVNF